MAVVVVVAAAVEEEGQQREQGPHWVWPPQQTLLHCRWVLHEPDLSHLEIDRAQAEIDRAEL